MKRIKKITFWQTKQNLFGTMQLVNENFNEFLSKNVISSWRSSAHRDRAGGWDSRCIWDWLEDTFADRTRLLGKKSSVYKFYFLTLTRGQNLTPWYFLNTSTHMWGAHFVTVCPWFMFHSTINLFMNLKTWKNLSFIDLSLSRIIKNLSVH